MADNLITQSVGEDAAARAVASLTQNAAGGAASQVASQSASPASVTAPSNDAIPQWMQEKSVQAAGTQVASAQTQAASAKTPTQAEAEPQPKAAGIQTTPLPSDSKLKSLQDSILAANVPQLVLTAISYALDMRSSDIHIEPLQKHVRMRYRVDGVLMPIVEYPTNFHPAVVSRIKIMSNLKIDEQRIPQDGRADVTTKDGKEMDLRVSTLPTVNGEKIVMRIQDKSRRIPDLPELGISGRSLKNLEEALDAPNGIIINTGPTGSGKTTTLYSCLERLNTEDVNILTIEDPVEIQMDGLNQSQVHHDIDYVFATGMRAALRQDPDIIMVGEIRDRETADTAIEASLTGHQVFSTLHTNSAVESITRLLNMGVPHYLLTSTIELIIAQRLVRKLCKSCKKKTQVQPAMMDLVKKAMEKFDPKGEMDPELFKKMEFYEAVGCDKCNNIGYYGRVGLYEVFHMNNELRKLISSNATTLEIEDAAKKQGMITLEQAGIIKSLEGITTLDEIYRVARKSE